MLPPTPDSVPILTAALLGLVRTAQAYSLLGCYTPDSQVSLGTPILSSSNTSSPGNNRGTVSVQGCEDRCSSSTPPADRNSTVFLMQVTDCFCYKFNWTLRAQDSLWSQVNPVECSVKCPADGLPCGEAVHKRYSMYTVGVGSSIVFPAIDATQNSTKPESTTSASPKGPQVTNANIGTGNGQDVYKILAVSGIVLGCIAFLVLLGVFIYYIRKAKSLNKLPQPPVAASLTPNLDDPKNKLPLPLLESERRSSLFLIPSVLPVTPNQIYSVVTPYMPYKKDEVRLKADHVVCLRQAYEDQWALGSNVTTGESGVFPLACLVSDESWLKAGIQFPPRTASLKNPLLMEDLEKGEAFVPLAPPPTTTILSSSLASSEAPLIHEQPPQTYSSTS